MTAPPTRAIVLWCPDWPIQALVRAGTVAAAAEVAVIDKGLVFASSAAARMQGVRRGLRVREAQARCSSLLVVPYDMQFDHRAFEPVLARLEAAVPGVQPIRPGMCAFRARGPARFYGGEAEAAEALLDVLLQCDVRDARIGVADGPFAAEQAAKRSHADAPVQIVPTGASARFLAPMPVDILGEPGFVTLLRRLGLRTLGDVAGLTAVDLHDRFGEVGSRAHALAGGTDGSTVVARAPRKDFERSLVFEPGLDRVDQAAFAFRSTAEDFVASLTSARLVCTAVAVTVQTESGAMTERTWLHPRWFTAVDVVDRIRWQLQGTAQIEQGLDSPIVRLSVAPESVDELAHHEEGLWGGGPDERIHHALSRVQSMLGHDAVATVVVGGGRMLAERTVPVAWGDRTPAAATSAATLPWPGALPPPLPATVFTERMPCLVLDEEGEPVKVDTRWALETEPTAFARAPGLQPAGITAWAGPWPIEQRWWDEENALTATRIQLVDRTGTGWLVVLDADGWRLEARYD